MSLVIDAHNHLGDRPGAVQTGAQLIEKLDKAGVQKAVVFPFVEGNFTNDFVRDAYLKSPDRLIPYCAVNPWERNAVDVVRQCISEWGFKGLKLHPTINGYHLADPELCDPLFKLAEELDFPIIVHGASDLYNSPPEFAMMAKRFPKVALQMAHMGFFWSVEQAITFAGEFDNLYLETSRAPIFEIQTAVKRIGPHKVIWGTDSPFVDYEFEFSKMTRATPDKAGYEAIVGGNIARLLKL
jgi:predicted TIM-barrel fold metal-dependent hydrolase